MTIGELARKAGLSAQTVRFYEREGLLPAPHRWPESGYRDFDEDALQVLHFIRSAKTFGFALREIRELLDLRVMPGESCREVRQLIAVKLVELDRRLQEMRQLRRALARLEASCRNEANPRGCPALWSLEH